MKIVHICLCGPMTDGFNYQENLLTKYHRKMGHDVTIIASQWIWNAEGKKEKTVQTNYRNADDVKMIRIPILIGKEENRLKIYPHLYQKIEEENPDILFVHDCQFLNIFTIKKYVEKHDVRLYVDNHVDYSNGAHGWISRNILHKGLWRFCVKRIEPYVKKFYGVLPARVDFLREMYQVPVEKSELLIMGADDELVERVKANDTRKMIREKYGIQNEFLLVTGGKINRYRPEVLYLMKAIKRLDHVKMIFFGSIDSEYQEEFESIKCENIISIGWIDSKKTYEILNAADLVVFPGLHSVMWEQTVALGIPMLIKRIKGFDHVDIGGNVSYIVDETEDGYVKQLEELFMEKEKYLNMKQSAMGIKREQFLYSKIACTSIEE